MDNFNLFYFRLINLFLYLNFFLFRMKSKLMFLYRDSRSRLMIEEKDKKKMTD
jgi:hypothetical protein